MSRRLSPEAMWPAGVPGYATHYVRLPAGGPTLRVVEHTTTTPPRATALLIHGWGCSAFVYRRNIPALAAAGIRVLAVDLPGHGLSDALSSYSTDSLADAILGTLDALAIEAAALVAHSLGTYVAIRAAERAPTRVSRLVLIAPAALGRVPFARLARAITPRWLGPLVPYLTPRWGIAAGLVLARVGARNRSISRAEIDEYWAPTQRHEVTLAAWHLIHDFDWRPVPIERLRAIGVPTLVIVGSGDRLVRTPADSTFRVVPGTGHNVQEQAPDEVNTLVVSFVTA